MGWAYALTLGFGLVYLGEHYVCDLIAGFGLAYGVRTVGPAAWPHLRRAQLAFQQLEPPGPVTRAGGPGDLDPDLAVPDAAEQIDDQDTVDPTQRGSEMLRSRRRVLSLFAAVALMIVAIYVVFPKVVGLEGTFDRFDEATWYWIVMAFCMPVLTYYSYAVLVRSVFGKRGPDEIRERLTMPASGLITLSALAASALFSAAGAGGVALTYWALRKAGMERRRAVCREVAFLAILYSVYLLAIVVFGVLLAAQVLPGDDHLSVTIVPAAIAGGVILLLGLTALLPGDIERRVRSLGGHPRTAKIARRLAALPADAGPGRAHGDRPRAQPIARPGGICRGDRLLGRQHHDPVGRVQGVRRRGAARRARSRASSSAWSPTWRPRRPPAWVRWTPA